MAAAGSNQTPRAENTKRPFATLYLSPYCLPPLSIKIHSRSFLLSSLSSHPPSLLLSALGPTAPPRLRHHRLRSCGADPSEIPLLSPVQCCKQPSRNHHCSVPVLLRVAGRPEPCLISTSSTLVFSFRPRRTPHLIVFLACVVLKPDPLLAASATRPTNHGPDVSAIRLIPRQIGVADLR